MAAISALPSVIIDVVVMTELRLAHGLRFEDLYEPAGLAAIDRAFLAGATSFVVKPLNWRLISYQIRYVHRTAQTEASLREARAGARADAAASSEAMRKLAQETAEFLRIATHRDPSLRDAGRRCAAAISEAAEPAAARLTGT